ncbi:MAG: redoxin domain-containing protein [Dehalococcoidales bacterium]|nr:redoxin domain-containing protein [Dehalococcoidales bacterium]
MRQAIYAGTTFAGLAAAAYGGDVGGNGNGAESAAAATRTEVGVATEKTTEIPKQAEPKVATIGQKASDFELKTVNGEEVKLSDYKGVQLLLSVERDQVVATVCASGSDAVAAVERWQRAGLPLALGCGEGALRLTSGTMGPWAEWAAAGGYSGGARGVAYCNAPNTQVASCAHELGHLLGLEHPPEDRLDADGCAGRMEFLDWQGRPEWLQIALGLYRYADATIMDRSPGCPGAAFGPYPADVAAVLARLVILYLVPADPQSTNWSIGEVGS